MQPGSVEGVFFLSRGSSLQLSMFALKPCLTLPLASSTISRNELRAGLKRKTVAAGPTSHAVGFA